MTRIKYGTGSVSGFSSRDQVCLESSNATCIQNFKMLSVVQTQELNGLAADGIIGLAPSA